MTEQIQYTDGLTGPEAPQEGGDPGDEHVESPTEEESQEEAQQEPEQASDEDDSTETPSALNFEKFNQEFLENGNLSDESFNTLAQAGIPKEVVEQYLAGTKAIEDQATKEMYASVGGEDQYGKMIEWASESFTEEEIDAYNKAIATDGASQKFALNGLKARYEAANGQPRLLRGSSKNTRSGFRSTAEMVKAMSDPRYKTDPAYRADVENRVKNASF